MISRAKQKLEQENAAAPAERKGRASVGKTKTGSKRAATSEQEQKAQEEEGPSTSQSR